MPGIRIKNKLDYQEKKGLADLLTATETDWYKFFDNIGSLIVEYSQSTHSSNKKIKRSIFFKFLKAAFSTDAIKTLTDNEKNTLFSLTETELTDNTYDFLNIDDLKMLYERFNIFLRVKHENWDEKVLSLITEYAERIVDSKISLDKNIDQLDWHFSNFFWVLNVNFSHYVKINRDYLSFKKVFDPLQKMNNEIRRWDSDSIFSFRTVLGTYRILRTDFKANKEISHFLDLTTKNYISKIVKLTEHQCFSLTANEIKECAYIEYVKYVKNLPNFEKNLLTHLYKKVDKQYVFPNEYVYQKSIFNVTISYQQLTKDEKAIINQAISATYSRVQKLRTTLTIEFKKPIKDQIFRLYIFKTKEEYVKYGPLWGINTAGGGYAQVRLPSENDLPLIYFRPLSDNEQWHETFIYQQKGDARNGAFKEGGNFRNLGHEIQHSLFYALLGQQGLHCLPSWMVEGAANALGNEKCFKEEAEYIKSFQDRLPKIERIINMSYSSGGDLYYFGSALFRFILEKNPSLLKEIIKKAQNEASIHEINGFIKDGLKADEETFNDWLNKIINDCSLRETNNPIKETRVNDLSVQYKEDLKNNRELLKFLQHKSIEFVFNDTVFNLTHDEISRHSRDKIRQTISMSDYDWFKSALEIYVLDNKLTDLNLSREKETIIESLVDSKEGQFIGRKIVKIYINDAELSPESKKILKPLLEEFVLGKYFNLSKNLKRSFNQEGEISRAALTKILTSKFNRESTCSRYIENQLFSSVGMLSDAPSNSIRIDKAISKLYQRSLNKNKALKKFIQKFGPIQLTFSDTVFVLSMDDLSRYDLATTPQSITWGDFHWFESALEIYSIKNYLRKKRLDYTENRIAEILDVELEYVSNRWIRNINSDENDCFRFMMQKFVSSFNVSSVLKNRLNQLNDNPADNKGSTNQPLAINESILGALTLFISNSSLILNSLVSKSNEISHMNDDACEENNSDINSSTGLLLGGAFLGVVSLVIAGLSFWQYRRKKATLTHSKTLKKDLPSEVEKLQDYQVKLNALKEAIKCKVSKDAYTLLEIDFSTIKNDIEILVLKNREGLNPSSFFNRDKENHEEYQKIFIEVLALLKKIKANLLELKLNSLYDKANNILVELRGLHPLPQVSGTIEEQPLMSSNNLISGSKQLGGSEIARYIPSFSSFRKISWFMPERADLGFPPPPSLEELQKMIGDQNNEKNGQQPIYANIRIGRN